MVSMMMKIRFMGILIPTIMFGILIRKFPSEDMRPLIIQEIYPNIRIGQVEEYT